MTGKNEERIETQTNGQTEKKIIWAVDPFAKDKTLQRSAAIAIKKLTKGSNAVIEPIYFLCTSIFADALVLPVDLVQQVRRDGQKELNRILSGTRLSGIRPLHIIPAPHLYLRAGVGRITHLAKKWGADLVVTSTHARKGLKHFALGSFAETLLLYSDVPLLFVNPQLKSISRSERVLFPTDFSEASKEAFLEVLKLAKSTKSKVVLFHKIDFPWPPTVNLTLRAHPLYRKVFEEETQAKKKEAQNWLAIAKSENVQADMILEHKQQGSLSDLILAQSKKQFGIIAMAARRGPIQTAILGSTIRKVVRGSSLPVWVLHPSHKATSQMKPPLYTLTNEDIENDLQDLPCPHPFSKMNIA